MMVWLHTSSPPQHIATIREQDVSREAGGLAAYHKARNEGRGMLTDFAAIIEGPHGEVTLHIWDTMDRANAWLKRNPDRDILLGNRLHERA